MELKTKSYPQAASNKLPRRSVPETTIRGGGKSYLGISLTQKAQPMKSASLMSR